MKLGTLVAIVNSKIPEYPVWRGSDQYPPPDVAVYEIKDAAD